jgi:N6-adenosine-specific RNA methylase IME4
MTNALIPVEEADRRIAEFTTPEEGAALQNLLQRIVDGLKRREADYPEVFKWEDRVRKTERKVGVLFAAIPVASGKYQQAEHDVKFDQTKTEIVEGVGVSVQHGNRWEWEGKLTDGEYAALKAELEPAEDDLSAAAVVRRAKELYKPRKADTPPLPDKFYACIVADPPWPIERIDREERPMQPIGLDYPVMELADIAALPVRKMIEKDVGCHLYLWTTHRVLEPALWIAKEWGFEYQCLMTWVKPTGMTPYSWMYNTEHCIFARTGPIPLQRLGLKLSFEAAVAKGTHSTKPDVFYERVREASVGPRLEMFARKKREGFDAWGNETLG